MKRPRRLPTLDRVHLTIRLLGFLALLTSALIGVSSRTAGATPAPPPAPPVIEVRNESRLLSVGELTPIPRGAGRSIPKDYVPAANESLPRTPPPAPVLVTSTTTTLAPVPPPPPPPATSTDSGTDQAFVDGLNRVRANAGLPALARDAELDRLALSWSTELATSGSLRHSSMLTGIANARGVVAGENVGRGHNVGELLDAFVASPAHYDNIVYPAYARVGVATVVGPDGTMWTTHLFTG